MRSNSLKESLSQILEPQHILSCHEDLDRYSCDALTPSRAFYAEEAFDKLADLIVRQDPPQKSVKFYVGHRNQK